MISSNMIKNKRLLYMTAFPPNENRIGVFFGVLYWMSIVTKTPAPQVMKPPDMLGNPPSIKVTVFSHKACLLGQKTQKSGQNR